ncbi:hepatitis A virus cellular receptor 1 homolog isoform X2 [Scyliorhinus canicula]|uniref:hepatitis A virus cellular receptor 1 homolog isoform X2 n=1 Tax=Scyliorhinus canicula TaxID=7830 RepID=UPI0018F5F51B|nr:hepatitis A virus cellular receptor 1 homolog isoform X2 [Scyliorhinus canicula]
MFLDGVVAHLTALFVFLGPVTFVRGSEVRGFLGQSVTLPCNYFVRVNGEYEMCWGRGKCPILGCSETLFTTNGKAVTSTTSPKYHLDGKIEEGDVSLTVDNLGEEDSGWYCCRVEIPGLFNDQKKDLNLLVLEGTSTTTVSLSSVSDTTGDGNFFTSNAIEEFLNSTFTTSSDETSTFSQPIDETSTTILAWSGVSLAILIIVAGIAAFILKEKLKKVTKGGSEKMAIGMHIHQAVEENVYNIE